MICQRRNRVQNGHRGGIQFHLEVKHLHCVGRSRKLGVVEDIEGVRMWRVEALRGVDWTKRGRDQGVICEGAGKEAHPPAHSKTCLRSFVVVPVV
jgi:hypothetical protein